MKKPLIIGIAGGSASGKTSVAMKLVNIFSQNKSLVLIKQDDYYKDQSHLTFQERTKTNYDHPLAFDNDLMIAQLDELANGRSIEKPTYDFVNHNRSAVTEIVAPADVIVIDGLFTLENEEIRKRCDIKIFVDADSDIRFIRRLRRDVEERGRTIDSVCRQYMETVKVMHEAFIEPSKKYADIIVPVGAENSVAMDLIITKVASIISGNTQSC